MILNEIYNEIDLLSEYMKIYVQFLSKKSSANKPTFEEFKEKIDIFRNPKFKERIIFIENKIIKDSSHGLGKDDEQIFYRKYCMLRGYKFFPANNFKGKWTMNEEKLHHKLTFEL